MKKKAIIVGINGQDGRCLRDYLEKNGSEVIGASKGGPVDILNKEHVQDLIRSQKPDEVYFLAAFHHSSEQKTESEFELWEKSFQTHSVAPEIFLESIRLHSPQTRFFFASSSLVFGEQGGVLSEKSLILPNSPYAVTKAAGMSVCQYYREKYGLFASVGILFNHESEFRAPQFLTKKIVRAVAAAQKNPTEKLVLGDLSAQVDWGYARDYVEAMAKILRLEKPDQFVISSGTLHSVRDFVEIAFSKVGLKYENHVVENPQLLQRKIPARQGDYSKLNQLSGWTPSTSFVKLIEILLQSEGVSFDSKK